MLKNPNFTFLDKNIGQFRYIALQGGTRSGKTYSVLQWIVKQCLKHKGLNIDIVRETLPALRMSAMKDFFEILKSNDLYSQKKHHKTVNQYNLNDNIISFFGADDEQKVRGSKRHLLFCNEANELDVETFRQLGFRTTGRIIMDYNPSMSEDHFIFSEILPQENRATKLVTTYKDNPFLSKEQIADIERLKDVDPEYWKIFGLGERGQIRGLIYPNFKIFSEKEWYSLKGEVFYGLDFGFSSSHLALVAIKKNEQCFYFHELLYKLNQSNEELIYFLRNNVKSNEMIVADAADPKSIAEIRRAGFNVQPAEKGTGSVEFGIRLLQSKTKFVTDSSVNMIKEFRNYKWKEDKNNKMLAEPVKAFDHALDAARYACAYRADKGLLKVVATN